MAEKNLKSHISQIHETEPISCAFCSAKLRGKRSYENHLKSMHSESSEDGIFRNHKCNLCHKSFKRKDTMTKHKEKVHINELIKCEFCHLEIKGSKEMKRHLDRMHIDQNRHHECDICDKVYRRKQHLRRHKFNKHKIDDNKIKNSV